MSILFDTGLEALTENTDFEVKFKYSFENTYYQVAGKDLNQPNFCFIFYSSNFYDIIIHIT
jgi:hypothetical protein